jgi:hypothetical protein
MPQFGLPDSRREFRTPRSDESFPNQWSGVMLWSLWSTRRKEACASEVAGDNRPDQEFKKREKIYSLPMQKQCLNMTHIVVNERFKY